MHAPAAHGSISGRSGSDALLKRSSIPAAEGFSLRAFGCTLSASAPSPEAQRILDRWIFPSLARTSREPSAIALHIEKLQDAFAIFVNGEPAGHADTEDDLPLQLIRALDDAIIPRLTHLRAVHAGAISWQGRALLLPGKTHAGKSSLVSELLRRGARYLSDEYALIDEEGRVHAYPRPLLVRKASPSQTPVLPGSLGAQVEDQPCPIACILSLEYHPGFTWQLQPLAQSEALMLLLRNTPHVLAENPQMIALFSRAVAGAASFAGRRGDAAEAATEILRLIDASAAPR